MDDSDEGDRGTRIEHNHDREGLLEIKMGTQGLVNN